MHRLILSLTFPLFNFFLKLKREENINERKKKSIKSLFPLKDTSLSNLSNATFEAGCKHQIMLSLTYSNST